MRKGLVIIVLVGLCLAFSAAKTKRNDRCEDSEEPQLGPFKSVDVKNPKVQEAAQLVLTTLKNDPDCSGFTLKDITKAEHKLGVSPIYKLKLRFSTADNRIKKCKVKLIMLDIAARQTDMMTSSKPKPAPYLEGCKCSDLTATDRTSEEEEDS